MCPTVAIVMAMMDVDKRALEQDDHEWFYNTPYKFRRLNDYVSSCEPSSASLHAEQDLTTQVDQGMEPQQEAKQT